MILMIIDFVIAAAICIFAAVLIIRQNGFKLGIMYSLIAVVFLAVLIINAFFAIPTVVDLMRLMAYIFFTAYVMININEFKSAFFRLTKLGQKLKKEDIKASDEEIRMSIEEIVKACTSMSKVRAGALIVIAPGNVSAHLLETGTELGALVTSPLLESIFITKGPCHDGAVIIKGNRILAAGCFLPLSQSQNLAKNLGTRHRAGVGITEQTNMLTIIVSEENGIISVAQDGDLRRYITPERLSDILKEVYGISGRSSVRGGLK